MAEKEQPPDPKIAELLNDIGHIIGNAIKKHDPGMGFTLFMYDYEAGGRMNYISNGNRRDMIKAIKEFIGKMEGQYGNPTVR